MNSKPIIEVKHLVKRYKEAKTNAVDDVSFSVKEGEFFAFLGPNGAGKTTTISILTTTLSATSGSVEIAGYDLATQARHVRRNIGIIFQNPSLDLYLTAEENVRMHVGLYGVFPYRPLYGLMPVSYKRRIAELGEVVGLGDAMLKKVGTFSGGMRRKLEIVRSLMHQPKILFLDEPTSGLDPVSRADLWAYLQGVRARTGTTIFLTTHYLDEAEGADRVCVIQNGNIQADETPRQFKSKLTRKEMVLDSCERSSLACELRALGADFSGDGPFSVTYEDATPQALIKRIHTPLTELNVYEPTLEEAYVDMVNNAQREANP